MTAPLNLRGQWTKVH